MKQRRLLKLFTAVTLIGSPTSYLQANPSQAELDSIVQQAYKNDLGNGPGNVEVAATEINGVTTYYVAVSRCDASGLNCSMAATHSFRQVSTLIQKDGHFYTSVGTDMYPGVEISAPQRLDFVAGSGDIDPQTQTPDFSSLTQLRFNANNVDPTSIAPYVPSVVMAMANSYQEMQNAADTSRVMHESYENSLKTLAHAADYFQTSAQAQTESNQINQALSSILLSELAEQLTPDASDVKKQKDLQEFQQAKADPFSYKNYDLTDLAQQDLNQSVDQAIKNRNIRSLMKSMEAGLYQRDTIKSDRFAQKYSRVADDGIAIVGQVTTGGSRAPLDHYHFRVPLASAAGQALRKTANLAQSYWSEQLGYRYAQPSDKALYLTGLMTLNAAQTSFFRRGHD